MVFWCLQLLDKFYGCQTGFSHNLEQVWPPFSLKSRAKDAVQLFESMEPEPTEIWRHSIEIAAIWNRVRHYVLEAMAGEIIEPWCRDSSYIRIVADMTELETAFPAYHRYDSAKFFQREPQELEENQDYWRPWLLIQFTYHAAQATLNHPFLYLTLSQQNPKFARSNTFWKKSMELVLLHSTWIARMIDMVDEKGVRLSDPFFACVATLAATVHMYYSCGPDQQLAVKSRIDLEKCRIFVKQFTSFLPFCKVLEQRLDRLIDVAFAGSSQDLFTRLHLDTQLIREIMNLVCQHRSAVTSDAVLDPSLRAPQAQPEDEITFEIIVATSPEINVRISDGGQATPLTPHTARASHADHEDSQNTIFLSREEVFHDSRWDWTLPVFEEQSENPDLTSSTSRDLWDPSWWGFGNL